MKKTLLHDEHGEPTGLMYIAIFGTLLAFGAIWKITNEGWYPFISELINTWRNL